MAYLRPYRVAETSTTTGTGSITVAGAVDGYSTFAGELANADTATIVIEAIDAAGRPTGQWEICDTVFTSPSTLSRGTLRDSSTGSRIDFAAGDKRVFAINPRDVADLIDFNQAAAATVTAGRLAWDADAETLTAGLTGAFPLPLGQSRVYHAKNDSGGSIAKGRGVMFAGVVGGSGKLEYTNAVSDGSVDHDYAMGIAAQTVANGDFGYVVDFGTLKGFDTTGANKTVPETWVVGDFLYFDPAYPGELTKVEPQAPAWHSPVAVVTSVNSTSGSLFVRMKTGERLGELHDVRINGSGPSNGQVLIYDAVQDRWENNTLTAGTGISVTNAAGAITIATTGGGNEGSWTEIARATANNSATIDFTGLSTSYDEYMVQIYNAVPTGTNVEMFLRTSSNNGSSYDAGASDYSWASGISFVSGSSDFRGGNGLWAADGIPLSFNSSDADSYGGHSMAITLIRPAVTGQRATGYLLGTVNANDGDPSMYAVYQAFMRQSTSGVNAIRFLMDTGNIASGIFVLLARRK